MNMDKFKEIIKSVAIFCLYILLSYYLSKYFNVFTSSNNFWISNLSAILIILIIDIILVLLFYKTLKKDLHDFKINYKDDITIGLKYWAYGILIMLIANNIIVKLLGGMPTNEEENRELLRKMPLYSAVVMCFLGPISEEIMFRLNFKNDFNNSITFAVFSGLIFGAAHILASSNIAQIIYIIPYGALGFCFAMAYAKTNNIFTSISIHSLHNIITILFIILSGHI
jgi:uncharacterized protein